MSVLTAVDKFVFRLHHIGVFYKRKSVCFWRPGARFWALSDVSFDVRPNETLGIIGRNGSGKSTVLKLLAGIIEPDRGTIQRLSARTALLSLGAGFSPMLSGRQNIFLNGLLLGMTRQQIEARYADILALAELGQFIEEPVETYSTGMRARLGFAIAYHADSEVILIDETLGVGDERFRRKSEELIKAKINHSQSTVVIVSHSIKTIRELCDRAIWIENGRSREELPVEETLSQYTHYLASQDKAAV